MIIVLYMNSYFNQIYNLLFFNCFTQISEKMTPNQVNNQYKENNYIHDPIKIYMDSNSVDVPDDNSIIIKGNKTIIYNDFLK